MTEKIDAKKFEDGLLELSQTSSSNGGVKQELELSSDLTDALNELSKIQQDQQQL